MIKRRYLGKLCHVLSAIEKINQDNNRRNDQPIAKNKVLSLLEAFDNIRNSRKSLKVLMGQKGKYVFVYVQLNMI